MILANRKSRRWNFPRARGEAFFVFRFAEIDDEVFGAREHRFHLRNGERPAREFREVTMLEKIRERVAMRSELQIRKLGKIVQKFVRRAMHCADQQHFFDELAGPCLKLPGRKVRREIRA